MIKINQQLQQMLQRLSSADRKIYDDYTQHPRRFNSDALLRLANEATDPELKEYLNEESWILFRTEEMRCFDCD